MSRLRSEPSSSFPSYLLKWEPTVSRSLQSLTWAGFPSSQLDITTTTSMPFLEYYQAATCLRFCTFSGWKTYLHASANPLPFLFSKIKTSHRGFFWAGTVKWHPYTILLISLSCFVFPLLFFLQSTYPHLRY